MFDTDVRIRTRQLVEAIAAETNLPLPPWSLSQDSDTRTLQVVEQLARTLLILPPLASEMAIKTKTIGTTGRDYSTITAWEADLDNGAIYSASDDAVGECYNDSAFDESVTINGGGTIGLTSVELTVESGERHDGTAGTGARVVRTSGSSFVLTHATTTFVNLYRWLEINLNGTGNGGVKQASGSNTAHTVICGRMLIHNNGGNSESGVRIASSRAMTVQNCMIFNCLHTTATTGARAGIYASDDQAHAYNCTIHDIRRTNASGGTCHGILSANASAGPTFKNNIVTDIDSVVGGHLCYSLHASNTRSNNLSSDTSADGTGSLTSKTSANQFVSNTRGSEDLHLKSGADAIDAGTDLGTTPTGVNVDIDGYDRDAGGVTWDMGAHEFIAAGGGWRPFNEKSLRRKLRPVF